MSSLPKKFQQGKPPVDHDWMNYLREFHDHNPNITVNCITRYPTSAGCSSYELLARQIDGVQPKPRVIVDLACGSGPLIPLCLQKLGPDGKIYGIDMSKGELEAAHKKISASNVEFLCEEAQRLSLPDNSVDMILSSLAFMLMKPVEPVVREIARILRPGGIFAATILIPSKEDSLYFQFAKLALDVLMEEFSKASGGTSTPFEGPSDPKTYTKETLQILFKNESKFSEIMTIQDHEYVIAEKPDGLWNNLKEFYLPSLLSAKGHQKLQQKTIDLFSSRTGKDGKTTLLLPFRFFSIQKR